MTRPARAKSGAFRRARLWKAALIALALGGAAAAFIALTNEGRSIELAAGDVLRRANPLPPEREDPVQAITIEIDDATIAAMGRWIWPRPVQARLLEAVARLDPRLVALDIEYPEPERAAVGWHGDEPHLIADPDRILTGVAARFGRTIFPFSLYFADRPVVGAAGLFRKAPPDYLVARHAAAYDGPVPATDLPAAEGFLPMLPAYSRAAAGSGYTTLRSRDPDHTVRRVPLLAQKDGVVFPHMALELAGLWQFGPGYRVGFTGSELVLRSADGSASVRVPVDRYCQLNLRWPTGLDAMTRIPARALLPLVEALAGAEAMAPRWREAMGELDALFPRRGWAAARKALDEALAADPIDRAEVARLEAALEQVEANLANDLVFEAPADAPARRHLALVRDYSEALDRVKAAAGKLRPEVEGKAVVIGLFATGITDQHKTPISPLQPGVTVYPAAMRTILSGVAFRRLPPWGEVAIALAAALAMAVATVRLPTLGGVGVTVGLSAAVCVAAWVASGTWAVLLPVAGPVLAVVVAFGGVSAYRQLTEARSRRWISRAFEQYTSDTLLREIQRNPDTLRLGGARRQITVLFSDIAGFTTLSERLDPERLVMLLNRYLSAMTEVLLAEGATLDKYEGDGILAFFGAPVERPDHALRGVRAALAMQAALPGINRDLVADGLLPEGTRLRMRVGCSSGPAAVGNFGSERRFDYTCMGDTVNLGGRLEEANRWLGTRVLVSEATRTACGDAVLFRPLGEALIRGKAETIRLFEPLAPEPAPDPLPELARLYGEAVSAVECGDLAAAEAALERLRAVVPEDPPSEALAGRIRDLAEGEAEGSGRCWNLARPK